MKTATVLFAAAAISSASAFAPQQIGATRSASALFAKGQITSVKKSINGLTKDNFSSTLSEIEPFLTKEAGMTIYSKSMRRINIAAKALGVEVPAGYAVDAKATAKRREKQDAYCKAKAEEAADAAAAEEPGAEEEPAAEEEEAPAEE